jgi:hypothetical protein
VQAAGLATHYRALRAAHPDRSHALYQPFAFLADGFVTFVDVLVDLALLAVLRYMQVQERQLSATPSV